jgi:hypothetical protein
VDGLWVLGKIVPEHIRIFQVRLRMSLLSVNEVWELGRVTDEEDGSVIEHPVPVTLVSLQLDSKSTGIPSSIRGTALASNGGESSSCFNLLTNRLEKGLRSDVTEIMGDFKVPMSTSTFGMDNTLRDALTIKVSEEIDVVEILKQKRPIDARTLSGIWLRDWCTVGSSVSRHSGTKERD